MCEDVGSSKEGIIEIASRSSILNDGGIYYVGQKVEETAKEKSVVPACVCGLEILALTERQEVAEKTGLGEYVNWNENTEGRWGRLREEIGKKKHP